MDLGKLLQFTETISLLQKVERTIYIKGENRRENDCEHQYQLAMLAWYIIESEKLDLDSGLAIKYALVHDFVEAYAGDTYFYGDRSGKEERERLALERLKSEFPEFTSLHELIEQYEKREDKESVFIYALDKLAPLINVYLDGGRNLREQNITIEMIIESKTEKIALSPEVKNYFDQMMEIVKEKRDILF